MLLPYIKTVKIVSININFNKIKKFYSKCAILYAMDSFQQLRSNTFYNQMVSFQIYTVNINAKTLDTFSFL